MSKKNITTKQTTVYITTFALTKGIVEGVTEIDSKDTSIIYNNVQEKTWGIASQGNWHITLDDAQAKVLKIIKAKRKSLVKELAKLDRLEAEINTAQKQTRL